MVCGVLCVCCMDCDHWVQCVTWLCVAVMGCRQLHQQLVANQQITPSNQAVVIETLRTLSELVVYGESKAELLFE